MINFDPSMDDARDKLFCPQIYWACDCLFMLGLKLNYVGKMVPGSPNEANYTA